jgi:hypothetical protein
VIEKLPQILDERRQIVRTVGRRVGAGVTATRVRYHVHSIAKERCEVIEDVR